MSPHGLQDPVAAVSDWLLRSARSQPARIQLQLTCGDKNEHLYVVLPLVY